MRNDRRGDSESPIAQLPLGTAWHSAPADDCLPEAFYHRVVDALPCGVILLSADGSFWAANSAAEKMLRTSHAALSAMSANDFADLLVHNDGEALAADANPIRLCLATRENQAEQTVGIRFSDGGTVWTICSAVPLFDPQSKDFSGIGFSFVDISARKISEEKLRRSEQFHRLISEISSDYGYSCRIDPDGTTVMDEVTAGFTRVTGYTLEELNEQGGWASFLHPDDAHLSKGISERIARGEAGVAELRIITKSGDTLWIRFSAQPIWDEKQQRSIRLVGAVVDISDRVASQQQLRENAERLQVLSRRLLRVQELERRRLACELHDEIGQLLTGLDLTLASGERLGLEDLRKTHARIQRLIRDLTTYIRDMSLRLRPTMLDDLGLLSAILWHFRRYNEQMDIRVHFEHSGLEERFDPETETAAFRILQEALTNVARHADVSEVSVRAWVENGHVCLQVTDEGRGFDADKALKSGTSTGLSGMRERAALLGGRFAIDSVLGQGTTIYAELPVPGKGVQEWL